MKTDKLLHSLKFSIFSTDISDLIKYSCTKQVKVCSPIHLPFDGVMNMAFIDDKTITVTTPPHKEGVVDVIVINADGKKGSLLEGFTYLTS